MEMTELEATGHESAEEALRLPHDGEDGAPTPDGTMTAAEALERLRRGETIRNVRIRRMVFQGEIAHPVRMRGVVLDQPRFEKATFREEVALTHCVLDRPRFGRTVRFEKGWDLSAATVISAIVRGLDVHGTLRCDNLRSRGKFLVAQSTFEGPVRFWEARFGGWVEFKDCRFADQADFRSLHADEGFVLTKCHFAADFLFRGATVCKKWDASTSRFDALLDLSKAKLHDFAYLEQIEQGPRQRFAFANALAERILVRTDQLAGRLASEQAGDHAGAMQEYGLLKRTFEGLHRFEQEDWAFYRFKVNQRRSCPRAWRRPWTKAAQFFDWLMLDVGCGYGTHPLRAVRAAAVIMAAFGLIYAAAPQHLPLEHSPFDGPIGSLPNRLMIGLLTSVSVFTAGFGSLRDMARGWMNLPIIAESLLGTLLWGLFIVAFSRKVIR